MPHNMGYCRFENTYADLKDCYDSLTYDGLSELSDQERKYAKMLIELSQQIAEEFGDEVEDED